MDKSEYLSSTPVQDFIYWIRLLLDKSGSFVHQYTLSNGKLWCCNSLYSAFESYDWKEKSYSRTKKFLDDTSVGLKIAIANKNEVEAKGYVLEILSWGGVLNGNRKRIDNYGDGLTAYLSKVVSLLHQAKTDTVESFTGVVSNSGFTKIYSLLIDDFVIYYTAPLKPDHFFE